MKSTKLRVGYRGNKMRAINPHMGTPPLSNSRSKTIVKCLAENNSTGVTCPYGSKRTEYNQRSQQENNSDVFPSRALQSSLENNDDSVETTNIKDDDISSHAWHAWHVRTFSGDAAKHKSKGNTTICNAIMKIVMYTILFLSAACALVGVGHMSYDGHMQSAGWNAANAMQAGATVWNADADEATYRRTTGSPTIRKVGEGQYRLRQVYRARARQPTTRIDSSDKRFKDAGYAGTYATQQAAVDDKKNFRQWVEDGMTVAKQTKTALLSTFDNAEGEGEAGQSTSQAAREPEEPMEPRTLEMARTQQTSISTPPTEQRIAGATSGM